MRKVLIAGCGHVGLATAELFHRNGWEVEGWTSARASADELSEKPFTVRAVDITNVRAIEAARRDVDCVIQCVSSRGGDAEAYQRIYLEGARNLAADFPDALLLFTSSTSVYAQRGGEWVTESSAAEPERATGAILRETEELVLKAGGLVARLGGIYGPGRSALLRKFLAGTAAIAAQEPRYLNQVHRDDVASAIFFLVTQQFAEGVNVELREPRIFNVTDSHPLTERECYEWLASHFERPIPPIATEPMQRKRGNSNKRVTSAKLQRLGWSPRFLDYKSGILESVLPNLDQHGT